ncbi:hypothetical protein [Pseudobacillus badius]|uniref:hypothetical protein n=1 Tax=Bacillus badius TaxID=1455 RepID=UPI0012E72512|nr:hypothetical protein [Bacillus badius]
MVFINGKIPIKLIFVIITAVLLLIFFFPLLVNYLFFTWRLPGIVGETSDWFVMFSTFYGAILGGIISGIITIVGVFLTINYYREKDFENDLINKIDHLEKVQGELEVHLGNIQYYLTTEFNYDLARQTVLAFRKDISDFKKKSLRISGNMYEQIENIHLELNCIVRMLNKEVIDSNEYKAHVYRIGKSWGEIKGIYARLIDKFKKQVFI